MQNGHFETLWTDWGQWNDEFWRKRWVTLKFDMRFIQTKEDYLDVLMFNSKGTNSGCD